MVEKLFGGRKNFHLRPKEVERFAQRHHPGEKTKPIFLGVARSCQSTLLLRRN